jgi:hypothetical protein
MPRDDSLSASLANWSAAVELAPMIEVWRRLLADHVPNSYGRCRACTQGGTGDSCGAVAMRPAQDR